MEDGKKYKHQRSLRDPEIPWKYKGFEFGTATKNVTTNKTYDPSPSDGDIIGISAAEDENKDILAELLLTVTQDGTERMTLVPLTQLLSVGSMPYLPLEPVLKRTGQITFTIKNGEGTDYTPILVFHFRHPDECAPL